MRKGLAQHVVEIWKIFIFDMTCLFSILKYGRLQSFTRSYLFVVMLFIFGHWGHSGGTDDLELRFISGTTRNLLLIPLMNSSHLDYSKWKNYVKTRYIKRS